MNDVPRATTVGSTMGALLPLTIMAVLALMTLWLDRTVESMTPAIARPVTHEPDYIVEKLKLLRLSAEGEPRYRLNAARMVHYPDDDSTHLTVPQLVQSQPGKPETRAQAQRGLVSADGREIRLYDQVELSRPAAPGDGSGKLSVRTSYLRVVPDEDRADTTEAVVIEQDASTLAGTGMRFDNRYRRIELLSSVRATLDRKK